MTTNTNRSASEVFGPTEARRAIRDTEVERCHISGVDAEFGGSSRVVETYQVSEGESFTFEPQTNGYFWRFCEADFSNA